MKDEIINKKELIKSKAVELLALNPNVSNQDICKKLNISARTLNYWKSDPDFAEAIYLRYMVDFGSQLPAVLNAMVREARAGNVQAGRLVLEHSGKLVKNINVTVDSPFEKFMRGLEKVEIVEDEDVIDVAESIEDDFDLPERNTENQDLRVKKEKVKTIKEIKKEVSRVRRNAKQKEWYQWKKRAKAVGIASLPSKRPTPSQREEWENSIIEAEGKKELTKSP